MATAFSAIIGCFGKRAAALLAGKSFAPAERERLLGWVVELRQLAGVLSREAAPEKVADAILDRTAVLLGATGASISWAVDPRTLSMLYARGVPPERMSRFERASLDGPFPAGQSFHTGEQVWLEEEKDVSARYPNLLQGWLAAGGPTWASIPLVLEGLPVGVLELAFVPRRHLDTIDRAFALALADECASALQRARRYEDESALRTRAEESVALLDTFIANIPTGLAFFDRELRYVRVNRALAAMNGAPADAHVGRRLRDLSPGPGWGGAVETAEGLLRRAIERGDVVEEHPLSVEHPSGSGRMRHWLLSTYPVRTRSGAVLGAGASVRDVTLLRDIEMARERIVADLERALESLHASEALLDSIYDHAPIGLAFLDRSFRFVRVNQMLAEMNGIAPEAHIGKTPHELLPAIPLSDIEARWRLILATGEPLLDYQISGETPAAPGRLRHWAEDWYPVRTGNEIIGLGAVVREVTEQKRTEELQRLLAGIVGHDLRNPLGVIATSARLLEASTLDARQRQMVSRIERASEGIGSLAQLLLDYTVIRAGSRVNVAPREADLDEVLAAVLDDFQALYPQRTILHDTSSDGRVAWDVERVRRLLGNLLSNAAKYGDEGAPIEMGCRGTSEEVVLEIRNEGPPIPPDRLAHIFEPLQQAGEASRRGGGIGLGLFIARQIASAHGGTIEAHSAGRTTTFTVRLPRRVPGAERTESTALPSVPPPP